MSPTGTVILAAPVADSTLADEVSELAKDSQLAIHRKPLQDLADALKNGPDLASWATVDLVATLGRPDLFQDRGKDHDNAAWTTQALQSVLVFVPIVVTWIGLALATTAYQDLISTPDGTEQVAGRSFLQLWQEGFDGHLPAPFTFFWMAVYTVLALTAVAAVTLHGAWRGQQAASKRQSLMARLVPVLVRAQVAACEEQRASPARFADELSRAAGQLGKLLDDILSAQQGLQPFGDLAQHLGHQLTAAATAVEAATGELGRSVDAGRTAMEASQATIAALKETVTQHVESGAQRITDLTDQVNGAAQALRHACDQLSGAGQGLSATLGQAGREGAEAIKETYEQAVAAAATSLGRAMTGIGANLAERVEDLQAITERYAAELHAVAHRLAEHHENTLVATDGHGESS